MSIDTTASDDEETCVSRAKVKPNNQLIGFEQLLFTRPADLLTNHRIVGVASLYELLTAAAGCFRHQNADAVNFTGRSNRFQIKLHNSPFKIVLCCELRFSSYQNTLLLVEFTIVLKYDKQKGEVTVWISHKYIINKNNLLYCILKRILKY